MGPEWSEPEGSGELRGWSQVRVRVRVRVRQEPGEFLSSQAMDFGPDLKEIESHLRSLGWGYYNQNSCLKRWLSLLHRELARRQSVRKTLQMLRRGRGQLDYTGLGEGVGIKSSPMPLTGRAAWPVLSDVGPALFPIDHHRVGLRGIPELFWQHTHLHLLLSI